VALSLRNPCHFSLLYYSLSTVGASLVYKKMSPLAINLVNWIHLVDIVACVPLLILLDLAIALLAHITISCASYPRPCSWAWVLRLSIIKGSLICICIFYALIPFRHCGPISKDLVVLI
jgi:hypothetical protein